jgi:DNA-binding NarL/FixJ family response regulator
MNKISVIIVDDHAIVRDGITAMLSFYQNIDVIGAASSYEHLVSLLDNKTPDVIILDIEMPDKNGIEIATILQKDYPRIKKIILSAHITPNTISDAVDAGVVSILPKDSNEDELYLSISKASLGEHHYSNFVSDIILKNYLNKNKIELDTNIEKISELSEREIEIIVAFGDGLSYKEIGEKLFISPRTVESHKNRILEKLKLNTIIDLVKFGIKNDLIQL